MSQPANYSVPTVGPSSPSAFASRIDDSFKAILSQHSGSARPSYAAVGTIWADTSVAGKISIKLYDGTDDTTLHTIVTATNADEVAALKLNVLRPLATIASAATTDLSTVSSEEVSITGTTTITSLGTAAAGTRRNVNFAGALTLTHNSTSLILPAGANIATAAGDRAEFLSLGSGNWVCLSYLPAQIMTVLPGITVATTSGTAIDAVGISPLANKIILSFNEVSYAGVVSALLQLGSGSIQTSGYQSTSTRLWYSGGTNSGTGFSNAGFIVQSFPASVKLTGHIILTRVSGNTWVASHNLVDSGATSDPNLQSFVGAGVVTLSGALDRIRLTSVGAAAAFDNGSITIQTEV